jgi:hypothetical protein
MTARRSGQRPQAGFGFRIRRACGAAVLFAALCPAALQPAAMAQGGPPMGAVLTDSSAYLAMPPELISGPVVETYRLSPGSLNMVVLRRTTRFSVESLPLQDKPTPPYPVSEMEIIFWNAEVRKPVSLWSSAQPLTRVVLSEWMRGTASVFALVDAMMPPDAQQPGQQPRHDWKLLLLGKGLERARLVPFPAGSFDDAQFVVSPVLPLGVLQTSNRNGPDPSPKFTLIHANGRVGARIDVPPSETAILLWDAAGSPVLAAIQKDGTAFKKKFFSVNTRTGQTELLPGPPITPPARPAPPRTLPVRLAARKQEIKEAETTEPIHPVWLESAVKSEKTRVLLAANGTDAFLLPDGDGAIYGSQNALWFAPILKINKADYLAAMLRAAKQVAISNGKQLGLATLMYAQDNGEVMPGPDGIQGKLSAYLGTDSLFDGFTYEFAGGPLGDIANPSTTVLGHVDVPGGGKAVIYVDGHVKWQDQAAP